MKEGNGRRVYSFGLERPDFALQSIKLDGNEDVSPSVKPFLHFDHHIVKSRRFANAKRKEIRPLLVADAQKVLESLSNEEGDSTAFPLQQSVCGLGGGQAHFNGRQTGFVGSFRSQAGRNDGRFLTEKNLCQ